MINGLQVLRLATVPQKFHFHKKKYFPDHLDYFYHSFMNIVKQNSAAALILLKRIKNATVKIGCTFQNTLVSLKHGYNTHCYQVWPVNAHFYAFCVKANSF